MNRRRQGQLQGDSGIMNGKSLVIQSRSIDDIRSKYAGPALTSVCYIEKALRADRQAFIERQISYYPIVTAVRMQSQSYLSVCCIGGRAAIGIGNGVAKARACLNSRSWNKCIYSIR